MVFARGRGFSSEVGQGCAVWVGVRCSTVSRLRGVSVCHFDWRAIRVLRREGWRGGVSAGERAVAMLASRNHVRARPSMWRVSHVRVLWADVPADAGDGSRVRLGLGSTFWSVATSRGWATIRLERRELWPPVSGWDSVPWAWCGGGRRQGHERSVSWRQACLWIPPHVLRGITVRVGATEVGDKLRCMHGPSDARRLQ